MAFLIVPALAGAQSAPPPTAAPAAAAADANPTGWTAKAGLSFVQTSGNSAASTLGLKFNAVHNWERTYFTLVGSGVRSDTTFKDTFAVGSTSSFEVVEVEDKQKTAENYALDASLDHNITDRFYWGGGRGLAPQHLRGHREPLRGPRGRRLRLDRPRRAREPSSGRGRSSPSPTRAWWSTTPVSTTPSSACASSPTSRCPSASSSTFNSRLSLDENLQATDDLRMTFWNSLGVNINTRFALQVSLLTYFDNLPALREVDVFSGVSGGVPVGAPLGRVLTPYGKWDNEFAVSLVINLAPKKPTPAPAGAK